MTTFYFVRHGETINNHQGRFNGGTVDPKLTQQGQADAHRLGLALADTKFDEILASPLNRAVETAEIILSENKQAEQTNLKIETNLRELDLGDWDGELIEEQKNHPEFNHYFHHPELFDASKIHGESYQNLLDRGLAVIKNYQEQFPDGNILIVTHGIVLLFLLSTLLDVPFEAIREQNMVRTSSLSVLTTTADGKFDKGVWV